MGSEETWFSWNTSKLGHRIPRCPYGILNSLEGPQNSPQRVPGICVDPKPPMGLGSTCVPVVWEGPQPQEKEHKAGQARCPGRPGNQPRRVHGIQGDPKSLPLPSQAMISSGVPVNVEARNFEGQTPLHCAVLAHNASLQGGYTPAGDSGGGSPTPQDRLRCVELLLQMGADSSSQVQTPPRTPRYPMTLQVSLRSLGFLPQTSVPLKDNCVSPQGPCGLG